MGGVRERLARTVDASAVWWHEPELAADSAQGRPERRAGRGYAAGKE